MKSPPGVDNGDRSRLAGEGEAGPNGAPPGDLYVEVRVRPHRIFERDGDNLYWVSSPLQDAEQEAPSEAELLAQLRSARDGGIGSAPGPSKMLVLADGDARHQYIVRALDAGTAVGMEEVRLASQDDEEM